mgnify:CR=1 FL=1
MGKERDNMIKVKGKKVIAMLLLILTLCSTFSRFSFATEISEANLQDKGDCGYHLQYWNADKNGWYYIITTFVTYQKDGVEYPAYCLNKEYPGVGEYDGYTVDIDSVLDNVQIWRTIINGYPYKTPAELGVENKYDAFVATKQAVYSILYGYDPATRYRGGDERGTKIANAVVNLVNIGRYGIQTPSDGAITMRTSGSIYEEGNYWVQKFNISSSVDMASYAVTSIANLPDGAIITNGNGTQTNSFTGGESLYLKMPKSSMNKDISNAIINVQGKCKTYPVFYGKTRINATQNYAVTYDPFGDGVGRATLNVKTNTGKIQINKTDSDTSKPIQGVTFQLTKTDGTVVANATTNSNGLATFSGLYQDNYKLTEISTNDNYVINKATFDVNVEYNKSTTQNIINDHKKGNLKIYKVDKDNHKIALGNVQFDLYSEEFQKVIGTYTTDVNGEISIENLRTGNYKLIEKNTGKWYNLAEDTTVEVKWNTTEENTIENELKKGQVKVIKVDKDNNEVKLQGVKFDVLDENGKILETITTDENGEAYTSRYAIRDYSKLTIREKETLQNYVLNDTPQTVALEAEQIRTVSFTNELKKGKIKVIKVDQDNNEVKLKDVEFKVYDEDKNLVDTLITDENGEATSKRLRIDKKYTVQESKTLENYVLNETPQTITLTQDQITDLTFENELIKGYIRVTKVSKEDNQYNGDVKGKRLENAKFEVYDENNNLVDTLVTDENGEATTKELLKGKYTLKEFESPDYYILTDEIFEAEIVKHQEIVDVEVENDNVDIDIEVNKEGFKETQSKDSIYYDFSNIHNKSNIALDNFTWSDSLPTNALRANKIYTGIWNEDLTYSVWYKTNLSDDYIMLKDGLSTLVNNEVKFTDATLQEGEFITDFEFRFGTVKSDFREVEQPRLYCDMLDNLPNGFIFVNHTKVSGNYKDIYVEDKDDWTTITYYKEIETTQKLPRTGC